MLRIALCDDEAAARETLFIQLAKFLDEETEQIVYEFSSGSSAVRWLKKHPGEIDLLFLDVEMPEMNGMETASAIREFDENLLIVFVTGYADYVFDGYRVGAMDYLMKPAGGELLQGLLERVRKVLYRKRNEHFIVENADGTYRFSLKDILYFYSDRRKVNLVTGEGTYSFYGRLDDVEEKAGAGFVRIHQRYLVNASRVEHIGNSSVELLGTTLPISRAMKETAAKKIAKAMLGGGF